MENTTNSGFEFTLPKGNSSIIKVIGVGGGGNNALKHMYEKGIHGVDFVICNTDAQALDSSPVPNKLQLGLSVTEGLGAGADPEVGERAALESIDDIKAILGQNTKMIFITAGMGGGTGTGAAPIIAKTAKDMGILTVGIVTMPFSFEGKRRLEQAEIGLEKLRNNVDSLIVINNDKLRKQFGNLSFTQGFAKADEVLTNAAKGMAEVITGSFVINIDFRDAKSVLENSGTALMSTGVASGENRAQEAVRKALDSPLLNDNQITGAQDVLLLIQSGSEEESEVTVDEFSLINDYIQKEAGNTANIIFGIGTDEELGDSIRVLVIATGFSNEQPKLSGSEQIIKIPIDDKKGRRESPFKSSIEVKKSVSNNETTPQEKNSISLDLNDADEDYEMPKFSIEGNGQFSPSNSVEQEVKLLEEEEDDDMVFDFSDKENEEFNLFSYKDFEADDIYTEEHTDTPVKIVDSLPSEESVAYEKEEEKPLEFKFTIKNEMPSVEKPQQEVYFQHIAEEFVAETPEETNEALDTIAEIEDIKFIEKPVNNKTIERRNKLQQFNSRYQQSDEITQFDTVPAFKRRNIKLDNYDTPSQSTIESYVSVNQDGKIEIKENRFLNKDVD
ncbi:cell division protein FtsZ [Riemerella columbipharyngis]|uniref:Cell division protein FtsZ n=1 Tax=Riemerella columbipharyngis TaxID=1071918 RepID=A0A1G7F4A5_9FLAO|nr:cell division protein FtsZ [Riemerella columbipharyngis]SDE70721.1 cell division protein FtsZ [Riemerella columbipharyngis]